MNNTPLSRPASIWTIHDVVIGVLSGGGVGLVVGTFVSVRLADDPATILVGGVLGAVVGVRALVRSHRDANRFLRPTVIVSWLLAVGSTVFIGSLASAISNFT